MQHRNKPKRNFCLDEVTHRIIDRIPSGSRSSFVNEAIQLYHHLMHTPPDLRKKLVEMQGIPYVRAGR